MILHAGAMIQIASSGQRVLPVMPVLLAVGALLVFAAGTQLYVSADTGRYFAWTIATPLTAAAIGAFYYAAVAVAGLSAWQRRWDMARVGVPGILAFLWLTIGASLAHLAVFHLHAQQAVPRAAAIAWLVIYIADPPLLLLAYSLQLLGSDADPPRRAPVPAWYRWSCAVLAGPVLVTGVALYAFPGPVGGRWAWKLVPIAAQTTAAWLIALALLLAAVAIEGDALRCRPASVGLLALAVLQLAALARYPPAAYGAAARTWIALQVVIGFLGGYGLLRARQ